MAAPADWNSPAWSKLWLYNLHYFNDLTAEGFADRASWHRHLLGRWVKENPPPNGNAWEPYPISLRIVNWIKWALAGGDLNSELVHSLAIQARYLSRRLEFHLLGNHLLANAKALIFAGSFFSGEEADRWLAVGLAILGDQLGEQFLFDGGHFELSPMYHSIMTEDVLDLIQLHQLYSSTAALRPLKDIDPVPALDWLAGMTHPDGEVAFFNDSAAGIASRAAELEEYANRLGLGWARQTRIELAYWKDSGYVRLQNRRATVLIDVGCLGPDYLPGHAHADTLSFELSLGRDRILVNSGTSTYSGPLRQQQRGTAAHNTLTVDEMNSSEVWGSFRVARRARPIDVRVEDGIVQAGHDGYCRLAGSPVHRRRFDLRSGELCLQDSLDGSGNHRLAIHFHLAPGLSTERDGEVWLLYDDRRLVGRLRCADETRSEVLDSEYYPEFGLGVPNKTIIAQWHGNLPFRGETVISWREEA